MNENSSLTLAQAIDKYKSYIPTDQRAFAILYTPQHCHLLLVDGTGTFFNHQGPFTPQNVFEARVFNEAGELRWLNESDGNGRMAIITAGTFANDLESISQSYLIWGEEVHQTDEYKHPSGWTKFATTRIGSYFVPIQLDAGHKYARFTAIEYLGKYEDGNVAIVDERLTGIESYKGGQDNG